MYHNFQVQFSSSSKVVDFTNISLRNDILNYQEEIIALYTDVYQRFNDIIKDGSALTCRVLALDKRTSDSIVLHFLDSINRFIGMNVPPEFACAIIKPNLLPTDDIFTVTDSKSICGVPTVNGLAPTYGTIMNAWVRAINTTPESSIIFRGRYAKAIADTAYIPGFVTIVPPDTYPELDYPIGNRSVTPIEIQLFSALFFRYFSTLDETFTELTLGTKFWNELCRFVNDRKDGRIAVLTGLNDKSVEHGLEPFKIDMSLTNFISLADYYKIRSIPT